MSQTSYVEQGQLLAGQKADSGFDDVMSLLAEGAVPFGRFVTAGTDLDRQGQLPDAAADITNVKAVRGIAIQSHAIESEYLGSNPAQYKDQDAMSVMKKGRVAVNVEEAVTPADAVFVRYAGAGNAGEFRTDDPGSEAAELANARFITSTTGAGVAILEVDL